MALLEVSDLSVRRRGRGQTTYAVDRVSLQIERGERIGILGESGCGKSTFGEALTGLLDSHTTDITGSVRLEGRELIGLSRAQLRPVRGAQIAMIFQDALSALTPVLRVGDQIAEMFRYHQGMGRREARLQAISLLERVGVPDPAQRARQYPHEFSGGMRQRVLIAMAIALKPLLLIADEPTTALDMTVQQQILDLLRELNRDEGMALLLITHDVGVIGHNCDRVAVMYAGRLAEVAEAESFMAHPRHPYARGLLASLPHLTPPHTRLPAIAGQPPDLSEPIVGCGFAPRCGFVQEVCLTTVPPLQPVAPTGVEHAEAAGAVATAPGQVACHRWREVLDVS